MINDQLIIIGGILAAISISIISVILGLFLFYKPALAIEIQRKFYEKINWRVEPIFLQKEIKNTKIMGLVLITISSLTIIYVLFFRQTPLTF